MSSPNPNAAKPNPASSGKSHAKGSSSTRKPASNGSTGNGAKENPTSNRKTGSNKSGAAGAGGALASLQKVLGDLKSLGAPGQTGSTSSATSSPTQPPSETSTRRKSASQRNQAASQNANQTRSSNASAPVSVPKPQANKSSNSASTSTSSTALKANAPSFVPSSSPISSLSHSALSEAVESSHLASSAPNVNFNSATRGVADGRSFDTSPAAGPGLDMPALPTALRLQAQAQAQLDQVRTARQQLPPRMQNQRNSAMLTLYENAVDDATSPPMLPVQFGSRGEDDLNALSSLAARAHRRTLSTEAASAGSSDLSGLLGGLQIGSQHRRAPSNDLLGTSSLVQQQINLQQQIETLQAQQMLLLKQQAVLQQSSRIDPSTALQQKYLEVIAQQQIQQVQLQQAVRQATLPDPDRQLDDLSTGGQQRIHGSTPQATAESNKSGHMARSSLAGSISNGYSGARRHSVDVTGDGPLPTHDRSGSQSWRAQEGSTALGNQHRKRDSVQTHRPRSSMMGSFGVGSFVTDMPEDFAQPSHNRSGSQAWRNTGSSNGPENALIDLNQAQTHLQQLAQFRAREIAGGVSSHSKMASFSFPNMLPNLIMASQMGISSQSAVQQQQAFQLQLQQSSGPGPQRKSLFAPYLPQGSLPALLAAGKLVVGTLRVNKRNRSDAYVATDVLDADIYICGSKDRNRALEGDIVAVELLDVDEVWSSKKDKEEKKRKKEENTNLVQTRKADKRNDDVEVEGQGMVLFEDEEVTDEQKPQYAGHVVAVVERVNNQLFTGQLNVLRPSAAATKERQGGSSRPDERPKIVWLKPTDKRVPLIAIPTDQAPSDFVEKPDKYSNELFVANIKRWPITSLHPFGSLVDQLGAIGNIEVETAALLRDSNVAPDEFSESALKCLPPTPWLIPDHEYKTRRDMRSKRVFTIDPETAKDLDDALSVERINDGIWEVGVHIADVSYFVKPNNALDREARKKATSVYLIQKVIPMLPPLLSEELCSLVPNVDRLTFSCFFRIDEEGNILSRKFERSIIKSCAKLAYADAQRVIEGGTLENEGITKDIKVLNQIARKLRSRRFDDGALKINNVKLSFNIGEDGTPLDCQVYESKEANSLIEEFMLLANIAAAQTIASGLPEQALLRRHEPPIQRRIEAFVERAKRLGYHFPGVSSKDIQTGFNEVDEQGSKLVLQILSTRAMNRAKYFCAGTLDISKYQHYALSVPLYTHFTSPIRRYADVLVHRMLESCMQAGEKTEPKFVMERDQIAKCAQHCNVKKDMAKLAQEQSAHVHLCFLIADLTKRYGPVIRNAKVIGVLDSAFDVVVSEFGIEKRVHADKMPLINHVYDERGQTLNLYWSTQDVLEYLASQSNGDDEHLKSVIDSTSKKALREGDNEAVNTRLDGQRKKSATNKVEDLAFEGLKEHSGHKIQEIKQLQTVPVIVSADLTKFPPVLIVYAVNPYAKKE